MKNPILFSAILLTTALCGLKAQAMPTDVLLAGINSPTTPFTAGLQDVKVSFRNLGPNQLTNVDIEWSVDGTPQPTFNWTGFLIGGGPFEVVSIGDYNFPQGSVVLKVWTSLPNGLADIDNSNDTLEVTLLACAMLSGNFTIGGATPDFADFNEAAAALGQCGIGGPVVLNAAPGAGPFNHQLEIPFINGASAANTITFNGNGESLVFSGNSSSRHTVRLNGAKHIIIENLNIIGEDAAYAWGIQLTNGCDSNVIRNCTIDLSANTATFIDNAMGIIASASSVSVIGAGNNSSNLTIEHNTIIGGFQGIRIFGLGSNSKNNRIINNTVRDFYSAGIFIGNCENAIVSGNDISRAGRESVGNFYGIDIDAGTIRSLVEKNRIHNTHDIASNQGGISYGIAFLNADATPGNENIVVNNLLYNFNSNGAVYGVYNSNADGAHCYHNTISLDHAASTGGAAVGFYQTASASNVVFKNNIVSVTKGGSGAKHCIYLANAASSIIPDYNVFFIDTNSNNVGFWNTENFQKLSDWQTANTGAYDGNSIFANPLFSSAASGNLTPTNDVINNIGQSMGVTEDFFGNPRDANNPDPGAVEFTPTSNDASIAWVSPVAPAVAGNHIITVQLSNSASSQVPITEASLSYSDGGTPVTQLFSSLNIPPGGSQNISFTDQYALTEFVTLKAYINSINGVAEYIQSNDTATVFICPALSGNFTVNKLIPASDTNFTRIDDAAGALSLCGVVSNVTIDIVAGSGPYSEQIEFEGIPGAGVGTQVVINGNGNAVSANPNAANRHIVRLDGTEYLTLNNLVMTGVNLTYGWGIHLTNSANHNTINNCQIYFPSNSGATPDNFAGIVASSSGTSISGAGDNANHNTISNCLIYNTGYGIRLNGIAGAKSSGNRISDNTIRDFYSYGVYLENTDDTEVSGNNISRGVRTSAGPFYGITLASGCQNTLIERNRIHNTHGAATDLTGLAYGIFFDDADATAGNENRVINNLIYNFNGNGPINAIYNSASDYARYYHNTIALNHAASTSTNETRGFFQEATTANIDFRNNIIFVERGGTGAKHCINLSSAASSVNSNHNVLTMNSAGGSNHVGRFGVTDFATLANWKTANGGAYDQNSSDSDPMFADAANFNLVPTNPDVNNIGTGLGVTTDFDLNLRNPVTPDPGAHEFSASVNLDAAIAWVAPLPPLTAGPQTITVNIENLESTTITDLVLSYTDGNNVVTETFNGLSIDQGNNQDFNFTTPYNFASSVFMRAYIDSVNGTTDIDQSNDTTLLQYLCLPLSGNYTIDAGSTATATNFQSFTQAVDALTDCGIASSVVFDVAAGSGPYNEQITIPFINGSDETNTISFNGNNNTLSFSPTTAMRHIIRLDGAKHVVINNLNITGSSADFGFGILFSNQADSNTVSGCAIDVSAVTNTQTANSAGIVFSNSTSSAIMQGNNGNYNIISNSTIIGGYYGVRINGFTGVQNELSGNTIRDFYAYGIYLEQTNGTSIHDNDISRANRVNVTTFNGIYLTTGNANASIQRNRIRNPYDNASNQTSAANGIHFSNCDAPAGQENRVINNAIYNMNSNGIIYGIFNSGSDGVIYYHNTISLDDTNAVSGNAIGFYKTNFSSNIDLRNNIISVKRTGSGVKHCVYFNTNAPNVISDYNVFYTDTSVNYIGFFQPSNHSTLASWQTVNGSAFDQNSYFEDPVFSSVSTGNLTPINGAIDNKGDALGITEDINMAQRNMLTPDIGAFEFTPIQIDATVIGLFDPINNACADAALPVSVVISNFGFGPLDSTIVTAYISGSNFNDTLIAVSNAPISNGQTDTVFLGTIDFSAGGQLFFIVFTTASGDVNSANDTMAFTRTIKSPAAQPVLLPYNDTLCFGDDVTIEVDAAPGLAYTWHDAPSGGSVIHTGTSFTSSSLDSSVIYYVEAFQAEKHNAGPADTAIGTAGNFTGVGTRGLFFDVFSDIILDSVSVYANDSGTVYVEITGPGNMTIFHITSADVTAPGEKVTIPVGFYITPGSYRIDANGSTTNGLYYNSDGASYPYTVPGLMSITGSTNSPSEYYFFYDWKISAIGCPSARVAAPVFVDSNTAVFSSFNYTLDGIALEAVFAADDVRSDNSYLWDFGDGATGAFSSGTHQYATDGEYTACLTVQNLCSQESSCETFTLCGPIQSAFSYQAAGQSVSFSFNGAGVPVSYSWDFGDGNFSSDVSPTHMYQTSDDFTVKLIVENLCGESDTSEQTLTICITVNASFTATQSAPGSLEFNFVSASTGNPASLTWLWGDGTSGSGASATHTYNSHNVYDVSLIATDACGASDTASQSIVTCLPLNASFTATVQGDGYSVVIANTSSGTGMIYYWDFGNGATSQQFEPLTSYSFSGSYTVTLVIVDPCGQSDTAVQSVNAVVGIASVNPNIQLDVYPNPNDGEFLIEFELNKNADLQIKLLNIFGQSVFENTLTNHSGSRVEKISMKHLPKGVYLLQLTSVDGIAVKRIIVE